MKLLSVNVGLPREVSWKGKTVLTGIFKEPVQGRVKLRSLNLEGDGQADLTVHGGVDKAVYAYPVEHYGFWQQELPDTDLPWGVFGENLTIEGVLEEEVRIGDRFRIGTAEVMVTQPRMPCYKLGIKFGREDMVKRFLASQRSGFYFSVLQEGELEAGDGLERISQDESQITVTDIVRLYTRESKDLDLLHRATEHQALPESWREYFKQQLEKRS
ncbi:MAG: MOSC domain-containing protein [Leptolyngbyaceae cyanobacterium SL_7_1]|nr:MOSC domain-containing protein [Leptolyngbyaceae cyanobacterium SL_7_1]